MNLLNQTEQLLNKQTLSFCFSVHLQPVLFACLDTTHNTRGPERAWFGFPRASCLSAAQRWWQCTFSWIPQHLRRLRCAIGVSAARLLYGLALPLMRAAKCLSWEWTLTLSEGICTSDWSKGLQLKIPTSVAAGLAFLGKYSWSC